MGSVFLLFFLPAVANEWDRNYLRQRLAMTLARALFPPVRNRLVTNRPTPRRKVPVAAVELPGAVLPAVKLKVKGRNERY